MFLDKINYAYQDLNETDKSIISVIMEHLNDIPNMGIEELSKLCNYSRTSILRTSKKLGFSGYSELRSYVRWEVKQSAEQKITSIPKIESDIEQTLLELENDKSVDTIIENIISCRRIFIYGTGEGQKNCANEIQRLFMQVGLYSIVIRASKEFEIISKELTSEDMVIVISLSGNIDKYNESIQLLKMKKVLIVSMTELSANPLASIADHRLYAVASEIPLKNSEPHVSFVPFYLLGEYLFRKYLEKIDLINE